MNILRRCAALIAAYAVALQLVLSAFAAVAPLAADAGFAICRGDNGSAPAEQSAHDPCAACLAHCAGAAAAPDRETVAVAWPAEAVPAIMSSSNAALDTARQAREHSPRAPPAG